MSDSYKLVFRGEVLEGQHPAVVRKRLGAAASFSDEQLDKLFSGQPVVVKRAADTAVAARLQGLFKKAGARLRVLPVDEEASAPAAAPAAAAGTESPAVQPAAFELLPAGSDVLREDERPVQSARKVDTGDLALEKARFVVDEPRAATQAPDVSGITLAELGADLSARQPEPQAPVVAPSLEVAEVGADLAPRAVPPTPPVDFAHLNFQVAPAGTELGQVKPVEPPPAPDVSHLSVTTEG
jgi:hypothetical protein